MPIKKSKAARLASKHPSRAARPQPVDVSAALIFHEGKLLITRRKAGSHLGGLWEFPGGKRETDETFEQCLAREIREELGIEIAVGELFEEITHDYGANSVRLKFFLCTRLRGEPQPLGCAGLQWIHKSELAGYPFPAADARLLTKLTRARAIWI